MDYAHHNLQLHHFDRTKTYNELKDKYWWSTMESDIRQYCETCLPCQFMQGSARHRAPLRYRDLPPPRTHVFADFLGPIYKQYYILVLVDYATGYTMLIPTTNVDAQEVIEAILNNWVKIFGWFDILETDWGSGFNNTIIELLTRATKVKLELAEPRNHRSIGKVERTIGFVQSIIAKYNVLLGNKLITDKSSYSDLKKWEIIQIILPFIQLGINQKRSRFTAISPNMLMLGSNVKDASELGDIHKRLTKVDIDLNVNSDDFKYIESLFKRLNDLNEIFRNDWKKYCQVTRNDYDKRWKITKKSIHHFRKQFKVGTTVLYFIGDREISQKKWRYKQSGPWLITKHLNDSTCIIADRESGNEKRVSFDRLKVFRERDTDYYKEYFDDDDKYQMYYNRQKELLYNTQVGFRKQDVNLDYTNPAILKSKPKPKNGKKEIEND